MEMLKIDREKLYGSVEIEAFDENGREASLRILAADGKTLIDRGGTALATVDSKGTSIDRSALMAIDEDGDLIEPVASSFNAPNSLELSSTDIYLENIVKSVYLLTPAEGADLKYLKDHLKGDSIYYFPFSYRGGLEYDNAFVLAVDEDVFMVLGKQARFEFLGLNQTAVLDANEENEISADDISFDLL